MAVTVIPNVTNWTVTPQNGQDGYFTLMNTWLGQSTTVIASLQTAITAQNTANSEINALATQTENNAILANGLANFQGAWSGVTTYSKGQSVESTSGSKIYYTSKVDNNLNHAVTDTNYWLYNPINDKLDKDTTNLTAKTTPIDADVVLIGDSVASNITKKLTWANLKATILSSFGAMIATLTSKTTPVNGDGFIIADSASSNASKLLTLQNLKATIFGSPTLTGTPLAPTATAQNNSTQIATTAYVDGKFTRGTAVASTSGTSIDFTGIPTWAKRITVMFNGVSVSSTANIIIQIGSGSITTSGYASASGAIGASGTAANSIIGYLVYNNGAANLVSGSMRIENLSSFIYVSSHSMALNASPYGIAGGGAITLAGAIDRVRITTTSGTDAFDAGSINIMYEG